MCTVHKKVQKELVARNGWVHENSSMLSCDRVFFELTRGPFPSGGAHDAAVEEHLSRCASCREMAEALRPPLQVVPESVPPEEGRNLPSYWGPAESIEPRVLSAVLAEFDYGRSDRKPKRRRRVARAPRPLVRHPLIEFIKFGAAVVLGLIIALVVFMFHF